MNNLIWIELNKKNLLYNLRLLRQQIGAGIVMAPAIKANAYGHGLVEVARILEKSEADWLSVNSVDEAEILRLNKIKKPIMVIGYTQAEDLAKIIKYNLRAVVYDINIARRLNKLAKKKVNIHIKVDTGMSRQGIMPNEAVSFFKQISRLKNLNIEGLATHFASSDEPKSPKYFYKQIETLHTVVEDLFMAGFNFKYLHSSNSAATMLAPHAHFNLVRPGISIYGLYPSGDTKEVWNKLEPEIRPVLSLKTKVVMIKKIEKGTGVSYGSTFKAKKTTRLAVLPIGYYDGIDRGLSNCGEVLIRGQRCPIRGRVCMNIMMVDVSRLKSVRVGDEVVIIGKQGKNEFTVDDIASKIGTINYEVTTRLRESIGKIIK